MSPSMLTSAYKTEIRCDDGKPVTETDNANESGTCKFIRYV